MQFLKPTFNGVIARHTIPPGGANPPSRYNPHDAIYAAAFYLCESGAQRDIRKALFAYNHSTEYVNGFLAQAKRYGTATVGTGDCNKIQAPNPAAIMAINSACGQLGLPYVWGGNGPAGGHAGFDCSGLTKAAYNAANRCSPATWSSTAHPAKSTTSACTSAPAKWRKPQPSASQSSSPLPPERKRLPRFKSSDQQIPIDL